MVLSHSLDIQINVVRVFALVSTKNRAFNQQHIPCYEHYTGYITNAKQHTDKETKNHLEDTFYVPSHSIYSGCSTNSNL